MIASRSCRAWSMVTPGRSRPVTRRKPASRDARRGSASIGNGAMSSASRTGVMKRGRQHADDRVGVAVEDDRRPTADGAPAEAAHPEAMGQDDDPGAAALLVLRAERPAERGMARRAA